jgi:general secretion pathway protein A
MVLKYYNLTEQPFGVVPDPRFLLMSRTHREALASLTYGLQQERGFMALAAPPGMGKTTLLFRLLESLRGRARTVFLFQTQCRQGEFCRYLVRDLGLTPGPDRAAIHDQLNQVLVDEARAGRRFVLIVDEAQGLKPSVLETIRLLSDFETPGRKLLQIIIAGQLGLVKTLMRQNMEQLRQRISMVASLQPFNQEEVAEYVGHRLKVAGHQGTSLFTDEALRLIGDGSEGIPRNINNICFNALSVGYALKKKRIGQEVIDEVLADLKIESILQKKSVGASSPSPKSPFALPQLPSGQLDVSQPKRMVSGTSLITAALEVARRIGSRVMGTPGQNLGEIKKRYSDTYGPAIVASLQTLNPILTYPTHMRVGEQIRFRANATGAERTNAVGANALAIKD